MRLHFLCFNFLLVFKSIELVSFNGIELDNNPSKSAFEQILDLHKTQRCTKGDSPTCEYGSVPANPSQCQKCSERSVEPNITRIVGGTEAERNSWPAEVFILLRVNGDFRVSNKNFTNQTKSQYCGGTILNRYTVMTAAHCLYFNIRTLDGFTLDPKTMVNGSYEVNVYAGVYNISFIRNNLEAPPEVKKLKVKSIILHEDFLKDDNSDDLLSDVALILLSEAVEFNQNNIQSACLPNSLYGSFPLPDNASVFASGRGEIGDAVSGPKDLLYNVQFNSLENSYCSNVIPFRPKQWFRQFCAGYVDGGRGVCYGDSGSGLYFYDENIKKYIVVGITSYGDGCARPNQGSVFTRLSFFNNWIKSNWEICSDQDFPFTLSAEKLIKLGFDATSQIMDLDGANFNDVLAGTFNAFRSLETLILSSNDFKMIRLDYFKGLKSLTTLDLSRNQIESIDGGAFADMASLKKLDLSENKLKRVEFGMFAGMSALTTLYVDHNRIESVADNAFFELRNLKVLDLQANNLNLTKENTFNGLGNLSILVLSENQIMDIEDHSFRQLNRLEKLYLEINQLKVIRKEMFNGLNEVRQLTLKNNGIYWIDPFGFVHLRNLTSLNLNFNNLKYAEPDMFYNLSSLQKLYLSGNQIDLIHSGVFNHLSQLEYLALNDNGVKFIEGKQFRNMASIKRVNFNENELKYLNPDLLQDCVHIELLCLNGNEVTENDLNLEGFLNLSSNSNEQDWCKFNLEKTLA